KKYYNMELVYLPLPAKYTLYHNIINDDTYNGLLPKIFNGLDDRGVRYVNIYNEFKNSDTLLYYRTDSHWNEKGIEIAYNKLIDYIKNDSSLVHFLEK
ncbi:MAG: hypothetical protein PVF73_10965, partial [Bacteroidales bacterium]